MSSSSLEQREAASERQRGEVLLTPVTTSVYLSVSQTFSSNSFTNERVQLHHNIIFSLFKIFSNQFMSENLARMWEAQGGVPFTDLGGEGHDAA